jgi:hypothetical protein
LCCVEPAQTHKNYQQNNTQNTCNNNHQDLRWHKTQLPSPIITSHIIVRPKQPS